MIHKMSAYVIMLIFFIDILLGKAIIINRERVLMGMDNIFLNRALPDPLNYGVFFLIKILSKGVKNNKTSS